MINFRTSWKTGTIATSFLNIISYRKRLPFIPSPPPALSPVSPVSPLLHLFSPLLVLVWKYSANLDFRGLEILRFRTSKFGDSGRFGFREKDDRSAPSVRAIPTSILDSREQVLSWGVADRGRGLRRSRNMPKV